MKDASVAGAGEVPDTPENVVEGDLNGMKGGTVSSSTVSSHTKIDSKTAVSVI